MACAARRSVVEGAQASLGACSAEAWAPSPARGRGMGAIHEFEFVDWHPHVSCDDYTGG